MRKTASRARPVNAEMNAAVDELIHNILHGEPRLTKAAMKNILLSWQGKAAGDRSESDYMRKQARFTMAEDLSTTAATYKLASARLHAVIKGMP